MKKALILAYDFPPYVSVGGLRPYNWFQYFKEFGIEPVVVTRQWSNKYGNHLDYVAPGDTPEVIVETQDCGTIIKTPYVPNLSNRLLLKYGMNRFRYIRKLISAYYEFAQFLFHVGTKEQLYKAARGYLRENKVDVIIATGDPYVLFKYASELGKEFGIPWVADYRDPWSQNKELHHHFLFEYWNRVQEKRIVKTATTIVTANDFFKYKISQLFNDKTIHVISNGFDPIVMDSVKEIEQQSEKLKIVFAGTLYKWHPVHSFLGVFQQFITQHPDALTEVHFYGTNQDEQLAKMIHNEFNVIAERVKIFAKIPNSVLLRKLAESNALLLFNDYSVSGTKIFDYIGIQRKILLCYEQDQVAQTLKQLYYNMEEYEDYNLQPQIDLIRETHAGILVRDALHLLTVLEALDHEFRIHGFISCDSIGSEKYSRKIQTEKLAGILRAILP